MKAEKSPTMLYILNLRLPTEKAHGLQIIQNCEAFADNGATVKLIASHRYQPASQRNIDIYKYYGVKNNFYIKFLFSLDLLAYIPLKKALINFFLHIQQLTFLISAFFYLLFSKNDIIYTRDHFLILIARLTNPKTKIIYEIHQQRKGKIGKLIQKTAIRLTDLCIPITHHLKNSLIKNIAPRGKYLVAHDGVKVERFQNATEKTSRSMQDEFFYVGYVGALSVMGMDKGVHTLIDAISRTKNAKCILIGGNKSQIENIFKYCEEKHINKEKIIAVGQVPPNEVPIHIAKCDALVIPSPFNDFFAYYSSPLKLFEYMASKKPIISSRLPSIQEVLIDGENGLFFEPSNSDDLSKKIEILMSDPKLREKLSRNAYNLLIKNYTWDKRAEMILNKIKMV